MKNFSNPILSSEWHPQKNGNIKFEDALSQIDKKVWWIGSCGHEWQDSISHRINGNVCPYCSGKKLLPGFNDLETWCNHNNKTDLLNEWDFDKNNVSPHEILPKSTKKIWWKCSLNHSYDMALYLRTRENKCGCPFCSVPIKKILKGFNDLATTHSYILDEWDFSKNNISPDEISSGSGKKVWWKCPFGHSYQQSIAYKVKSLKKSTCPYCSHHKVLKGFNDLATTHSYILDEWDFSKNNISPDEISAGSGKKVWWKCPFGHSYQSTPYNRCGKMHSGCPICDKENHTSFQEQAILYYIKKFFPNTISSDKKQIGMELDIYIPSLKIAIEYDGKMWHKNNAIEEKKNILCKQNDITLIRVRESGLSSYKNCICILRDNNSNKELSSIIEGLLYKLCNTNVTIDVDADASDIYAAYISTRKAKSLAITAPELALEWHPHKNGSLTAMMFSPGSNKKVWWLGACGHEYQMSISDRTTQQCGCPYCSGKRILKGFNDLETWCTKDISRKVLLDEWDFEKNNILPSAVSKSSDKQVYWKCKKCSHIWQAKIDSRTRMNSSCPKCAAHNRNAKPIVNLDTGKIYNSILEAAQELCINRHSIGNVCNGKQKTAGGFHWSYYK